jgi:hypothetical protein
MNIERSKDEELSKYFLAVVKIAIACKAQHVIAKVFLPLKSEDALESIRLLSVNYTNIKYIKTSLNLFSDELYVYASNRPQLPREIYSHEEIVDKLSRIHINEMQKKLKSGYTGKYNHRQDKLKFQEFLKAVKWDLNL